ncbi:MAG TPA: SusC/RagA family TonB-linked outer membrane protein, partial [Anditalea sp.]|nr:SusC/RagA family TonB-linked outer membrane protein [Anditalea sp.]
RIFTKSLLVALIYGVSPYVESPAQTSSEFAKGPTDNISSEKRNIKTYLEELEKLYNVSIAYQTPDLESNQFPADFRITTNLGIEENLKKLLKDTNLTYRKGAGNFYLLVKNQGPTSISNTDPSPSFSKEKSIEERGLKGLVVDENNEPIPGATILIKGTTIGAVADLDGRFSLVLEDDSAESILICSLMGYKNKEIKIGSTSDLTIKLQSTDISLGEIVVTAFGLERDKKALGYTTQSIDGTALTEARQGNIANNLSGRIAGVQVTGNSMPGSGAHIVIRGSSSVAGNNQPLVVVDGVPLEQTSSRQYGNGLSEINPDNIKEINVLKGATAAALYGSRAANGVIMVTTKDGSTSKGIGVEFNTNTTFDRPLVKPGFQNTYGGGAGYRTWYVDGRNGFDANGVRGTAGVDESWGAPMDGRLVPLWYSAPGLEPLLPQPNNWDDYWETGRSTSNNIAISGANEQGNFRLSIGRLDQESIMYNNDYYRNNFKLNTGYNFTSDLQVSISAEYIKSGSENRRYASGQDFIWAHRHTDYNKLKDWEQYYDVHRQTFRPGDDYPYANWQHEYFSNPFFLQDAYPMANEKDRLLGNIALNYRINDNFSIMARSGTDFWSDTRTNVTSVERTKNSVRILGAYQEIVMRSQETNNDVILTFDKDFSQAFSLRVQAGGINRTNFYKRNQVNVGELTIDRLYNLGNYASPVTPSSTISRQEVNSVFGAVQMGFNNYVFLDVTGRNDWSSTLPVNNNSFFYPSVALSAVLTDMVDLQSDIISFVKVRGSIAQVGNDADPYKLNQVFQSQGLWAGTTPTYSAFSEIANTNLKPEITTGKEFGLDMRFLKGRLGVDFTYYHQATVNQILAVSISTASGYGSQILNAGKITNQGVELMIYGTPVVLPNGFVWETNFNFARNRNQVVELAEGLENYILGTQNSLTSEARVGQPYGTLYGRRYLRAPGGDLIYRNGLPVLEDGTFALGNVQPDWIGGLSNSFSYRGFTIGTLIDVRMGGDIFDVGTGLARKTGMYEETAIGREEGVIGQGVMNVGSAESPVYVPNDVIVDATTFWNAQN